MVDFADETVNDLHFENRFACVQWLKAKGFDYVVDGKPHTTYLHPIRSLIFSGWGVMATLKRNAPASTYRLHLQVLDPEEVRVLDVREDPTM